MTKEKNKNIIIGVVAAVLIIGGVFYHQKKNEQTIAPENTNPVTDVAIEGENTISAPEPEPAKEELLREKVDSANAEELKVQETAKKAKWNTAMNNARTAFGKGEYDKSIAFYNEALSYYKTDTGYSGLFVVYGAQNNIDQARIAIESAIRLNPLFTEYWISKLELLDDKTNVSYEDLQKIYSEGLLKVDPKTKINLVTYFAGSAEKNGQKSDAISIWEYAKNLYPQNSSVYQGEIDRLRGKI